MIDPCPRLVGLVDFTLLQPDRQSGTQAIRGFPLSASCDMDLFSSSTDSLQELESTDLSQVPNSSLSSPADSAPNAVQDTGKFPQCDAQIISVYLPDLFSSIMAVKPIVNPNYHEVKTKADLWITTYACLDLSLRWTQINTHARQTMTEYLDFFVRVTSGLPETPRQT